MYGTIETTDTLTVDVEEHGFLYGREHQVKVKWLVIVFVNQKFSYMEINGTQSDSVTSSTKLISLRSVPAWALPWTVYLFWDVYPEVTKRS